MAEQTDEERRGLTAAAELPTGIVTFLFSDIEGSTRLVQGLAAGFVPVLEQHQALMRSAITEHGGVEVSTEGDSFFAVFSVPGDALAAAADVQRSHAGHSFPEGAVVRVRIGVHTGRGQLGGDNYVGLDVHRGARIAAAAHGGEVLFSETTRALIGNSLGAGLEARDLGLHRLKDLDAPERLYRLLIDGLLEEFPPPRSMGSAMSLPRAATSFVGRDEELQALSDLLGKTRLLTLTGPGGTGKTRLALETARRAAPEHRDGAYFVALDAIRDADLVASATVEALGVTVKANSAEEALIAHLVDRQLLLLFDNFEQVMPAAALVDRLLTASPGLCVIVTSRTPLQLYGEQEYRVAPLPTSASVELFVERARAVDPNFALTDATAMTVAEICARLDGLPLAIELAAARVKLLAPSAILGRLGHRLELLAVQSPNLPPRQRTMRAAIDWSWELLDATEQKLLERIAVFRGGFDLDAVEVVCLPAQLGIELLDGTESLLDKSLIVRAQIDETRFTMLQTITEYASERLAQSGEADAAARRHASYFLDLATSLAPSFSGAGAAASTARIVLEQDNIRAALEWSIASDEAEIGIGLASAVWRFWQRRGQLREGREWLGRLLALPTASGSTLIRARALTTAGDIAYWQGDAAMDGYYNDALAIFRILGDNAGIAESLQNIGFARMTKPSGQQGATDDAAAYFRESLAMYRELDDQPNIASVEGALGYTQMMAGRPEEARASLKEALALNSSLGLTGRANDNRRGLADINRLMGDFEDATAQYRAVLLESHAMGDAGRTLTQLTPAASLLAATGRLEESVRIAGAVERARDEQGGMLSFGPAAMTDPVGEVRKTGTPEDQIQDWLTQGREMSLADAVEYAITSLGAQGHEA